MNDIDRKKLQANLQAALPETYGTPESHPFQPTITVRPKTIAERAARRAKWATQLAESTRLKLRANGNGKPNLKLVT